MEELYARRSSEISRTKECAVEYVILFKANDRASLQMLGTGAEGAGEQRRVIRHYGGKVKTQAAVLGRYDAVLVVDFPSQEACLAYCLSANAAGSYAEPMPILPPDAVDAARAKATDVAEKLHRSRRQSSRANTAK